MIAQLREPVSPLPLLASLDSTSRPPVVEQMSVVEPHVRGQDFSGQPLVVGQEGVGQKSDGGPHVEVQNEGGATSELVDAEDAEDGRELEEKRWQEKEKERRRRIYEKNKRLRQGGPRTRAPPHPDTHISTARISLSTSDVTSPTSSIGTVSDSTRASSLADNPVTRISHSSSSKPPPEGALPLCPEIPPRLRGRLRLDTRVPQMSEVSETNPEVLRGGESRPGQCTARHQVSAIILVKG